MTDTDTDTDTVDDVEASGLSKGLKQRHMTMSAIGGTIGAGLFVGSGTIIHAAGPASLVSFLIAGVLITLVTTPTRRRCRYGSVPCGCQYFCIQSPGCPGNESRCQGYRGRLFPAWRTSTRQQQSHRRPSDVGHPVPSPGGAPRYPRSRSRTTDRRRLRLPTDP